MFTYKIICSFINTNRDCISTYICNETYNNYSLQYAIQPVLSYNCLQIKYFIIFIMCYFYIFYYYSNIVILNHTNICYIVIAMLNTL